MHFKEAEWLKMFNIWCKIVCSLNLSSLIKWWNIGQLTLFSLCSPFPYVGVCAPTITFGSIHLFGLGDMFCLSLPLLLHHVKYILVCIIIVITFNVYCTNGLCFQHLFHMGYVFTVISQYHGYSVTILRSFDFSLINKFTITFARVILNYWICPIW